jgi:hypothetical protein
VTNYNGYNVSCNGGSDGSAQVGVIGGTAPYSYLWSTGSTDQTATGMSAGSYSVTVTDALGCVAIQTGVVLTEPPGAGSECITGTGCGLCRW